jgi:endonuclease G
MQDSSTIGREAKLRRGRQTPDDSGVEGASPAPSGGDGLEQPVARGDASPSTRRRAVGAPARAPQAAAPAPVIAAVPAGGAFSVTIPLTITVTLGQAGAVAPTPATTPGARPSGAGEEALGLDPDWSTRRGYDPGFLGVDVPLPKLSAALAADTVEVPAQYQRSGNPFVLDYHHYSVAMCKSRCFAWYSAANIDGRRKSRQAMPKRSGDVWHIDPRIDDPDNPQIQCGNELYATAQTDRGHLTRYLDVAWGATLDDAMFAAADTFHFTNCCLQLSGFNQGKDRWQGIESFLLERFAREQERLMTVITGPLFRDSDPVYQNEYMSYSIPIPLEFWKVCVLRRKDGTLAATAFVMGQQDVKKLPGFEERFDVTATQRTIAEIESLTGLDFGPLRKHDHFAAGGAPGTLESAGLDDVRRKIRPLTGLHDIVL